uniref:Myb/SANT-like DNA-binding domain-containing protein n=1 Tax=Anabas testudineus TaxID=64144 RepID=A0A7N6AKJ6_ANATE
MEPMVNWSYEETRALIAVWSEEKIQQDLQVSVRNEKVYREVSGRLAALGMSRSAKQCRQKIKKLKQEYRKIKIGHRSGSNSSRTTVWFAIMDDILSSQAAAGKRSKIAAPLPHSQSPFVVDVDTNGEEQCLLSFKALCI